MIITTLSTTEHPLTVQKYRADIDGLRAISIILVVIFHAFPRFIKGGFIGVDVFFVISGYLISKIIFSNLENKNFSYIKFYSRRIKRILPALILVIMSSAAFGWYVLLADEYQQLGKHIIAGTGFFSNFALWGEAGYFDRQSFEKPLLHLWSLAIEEQFYIFWPLLLGLAWKNKWNFLTVIIIVLSSSFITNIYLTNNEEISAFYAPWSRFWELMIGCLLAYIALYKPELSFNKNWQPVIGLILIFLAAFILNKQSALPGWWMLMPTIGAFLIINTNHNTWINHNFFSNPALVLIGLISYPLYLWHWPVFSFIRIILFKKEVNPLILIAAIFISVFFAWITYNFLEKKIRRSQKSKTTIALLVICIFFALIGLYIQQEKLITRHGNMNIEFISRALEDTGSGIELQSKDINHLNIYYLQNDQEDENVLFIGDSHVWHYIPRLIELSQSHDFNMKHVYFALINGCPMIPDAFDDIIKKCKDIWVERLKFALNPRIKSVVIGSCWNCVLTSTVENPIILSTEDPRKKYALNLLENLLKKIAATKKTYLLLDSPNNKLFNPRNFFSGSRLGNLVLRELKKPIQLDNEQKKLREELIAIAHRAGAIVIDPVPSLCPDNKCYIITDDGNPIYIDNHHLSASWVRKFSDYIDATVKIDR